MAVFLKLGQEIVGKRRVFVVNAASVKSEALAKDGADRVQVRYLIDERHGSDRFALRMYTVEKGGHTPLDQHEYEHQVYTLSGEGLLKGQVSRKIQAGDTIFIPSNAVHQFFNESDEPLVFLCIKGNPKLYISGRNISTSDHLDKNFC